MSDAPNFATAMKTANRSWGITALVLAFAQRKQVRERLGFPQVEQVA